MNEINRDVHEFDPEQGLAQPVWPKPVGIVSIVLGGFSLTCGGCGLVMSAFSSSFMKGAEEQLGPVPPDLMPSPTQMLVMIVSMISPILLLIAGVMTLSRRASGRVLHLVHAPLGLVFSSIGMVLGIQQQARLAQWFSENPSSKWAENSNPVVAYLIMGVMTLIGVGWPVFCVIWFGVMKKRPEVGRFEVPV